MADNNHDGYNGVLPVQTIIDNALALSPAELVIMMRDERGGLQMLSSHPANDAGDLIADCLEAFGFIDEE